MPVREWRASAPDSRHRERRRMRLQIGIATAALALLLTLGVALYVKARSLDVATDPATLCPVAEPPADVTVVLLDVSDRFSDPQRLRVRNELARIRDAVPRFGRLELYALDRAGERLTEPVASLCNPGTGEDLNELYQNPGLAQRRWQSFAARLEAGIAREIGAGSAPRSPIFEAIQATALRTFARPELDGVPKTLIIVSDLLQHVPGRLSMYASVPEFTAFAGSPYYSQVRADLTGVEVVVYYLARSDSSVQGESHLRFWEAWFRAQGAAVATVETVYGDR